MISTVRMCGFAGAKVAGADDSTRGSVARRHASHAATQTVVRPSGDEFGRLLEGNDATQGAPTATSWSGRFERGLKCTFPFRIQTGNQTVCGDI